MSRSSTAANTPGAGFSPAWVMDNPNNCHVRNTGNVGVMNCSAMSVSSQDSGSDYSVPRLSGTESWSCRGPSPCECDGPPRPPKPDQQGKTNINTRQCKKPPMPLPQQNYGNYDVPKTIYPQDEKMRFERSVAASRCSTNADEYYDTPKSLRECVMAANSHYDRPAVCNSQNIWTQANQPHHHHTRVVVDDGLSACPCRRLICWPSNWITLPYCRRGNGIENTSVHLHKVKLSGEGKMPVVNKCGELAIYATVDKSKKAKYRRDEEAINSEDKKTNLEESQIEEECNNQNEETTSSNYVNIEPTATENQSRLTVQAADSQVNYENLDFAQSLEHYENSKDVLQRAGLSVRDEALPAFSTDKNGVKFCNKCGHACQEISTNPSDDYLMMEPGEKQANKFPGYLPMHPAQKPELLKNRLTRGLNDRAASIPSLAERSRRSDSEMRVPGSAMLGVNHPQSANSSPYLRRHPMVCRKRSSSADSTRYEDDDVTLRCSQESVGSTAQTEAPEQADSLRSIVESVSQDSCPVPVRRSSSVPCKPPATNRDSSSSNDSGVSTGSLRTRTTGDFAEFELPLTTSMSSRRHLLTQAALISAAHGDSCLHASLPRRSKSSDPLKELSFQFPKVKVPAKSSSAEAEIPICHGKREPKEYCSPNGDGAIVVPYIDSRSTSSGTSDMSDYIETLSMSSHSSSDTPDSLRLGRVAATTLRPRSGKEYHKIDRYILDDVKNKGLCPVITTVPEKSESPSPGYMSSSPAN
ncbi:hypothetical protein O3M35_009588 [Rhynocoris fuscipes]|uniref:Uncharacterized protein n=1 Tax=Rhynocoris fuscipes TaxID=488301 RepID=A0AAW1D676_9HEMI